MMIIFWIINLLFLSTTIFIISRSLFKNHCDKSGSKKGFCSTKKTVFSLMLTIPLFVICMYFYLGRYELIGIENPQLNQDKNAKLAHIKNMVLQLEKQSKNETDNIETWSMLYQAYKVIKNYPKAIFAAENMNRILPDDPNILLRYADAIALNNGGSLYGKPITLIERALKIDPENKYALWLIGIANSELGEYQTALNFWNKLLPKLKNDPESEKQLLKMIDVARSKTNHNNSEKNHEDTDKIEIIVDVLISSELEKELDPNDILFIYAKSLTGLKAPLAVVRKTATGFPIRVILDDSKKVMSSYMLSEHKEVNITGRISKSGTAMAKAGDLIGKLYSVSTSEKKPIKLLISEKLK